MAGSMIDLRASTRIALVAAVSAVGMAAGMVRAADAASAHEQPYTLQPQFLDENLPGLAPGAPPTVSSLNTERRPLMALLDKAGAAQSLDAARININGYIEGSYTYNTSNPARQLNLGRVFDINDNRGEINQIDLNIERLADPHQFDLGGRLEMLYGTDARFIHGSDFIDYGNKNQSSSQSSALYNGPEYQFDIPQIYLDLSVPIGNGLRIRAGKFLFFKQIDPNASVFYSHSFTFGAALPFTLTGVTAYYPISDQLSVEGGISRGWGQTLTDNNGAIDALARVRYKINDKTDASLALIVGPELFHDNSHYRQTLDATLSYQVNDKLTLLFDGVYGDQAQPTGINDDEWYGVSAYAVYVLCTHANLNVRGEFYRDEQGFTTGVAQTLYEGTVGLTITPFPEDAIGQNFKVRPEARYDYSSRNYFNGLTDHGQFTLAIDAYFDF